MVYSKPYCLAVIKDCKKFINKFKSEDTFTGTIDNHTIFWTCPKCKHGSKAGEGVEHTRKQGCRYDPDLKTRSAKGKDTRKSADKDENQMKDAVSQLRSPVLVEDELETSDTVDAVTGAGSSTGRPEVNVVPDLSDDEKPTTNRRRGASGRGRGPARQRPSRSKKGQDPSTSPASSPAPPTSSPTVDHHDGRPIARRRLAKKTPPTDAPEVDAPVRGADPNISTDNIAVDRKLIKNPTPTFRLRDVVEQLRNASSKADIMKLLLGLHFRLWHAPPRRLHSLLQGAGCPQNILAELEPAIKRRVRCRQFALPLPRPTVKAELAQYFNHMVQADAFNLFDMDWNLMIDECFRYKSTEHLPDHSYASWVKTFMVGWFRFFGPPVILTVDQEGALKGDEMGMLCDRFRVQRRLGGSDPSRSGKPGSKHTQTGLVERHVGLVKSTALKVHADYLEQGMPTDKESKIVLLHEVSMAHNTLFVINGVSPNMGVLGQLPREFDDIENPSLADGKQMDQMIAADRAISVRRIAKACTLKTIAESRLAKSDNTHSHKSDAVGLKKGTLVDIYRAPDRTGAPGWRGPAILLDDLDREGITGSADVRWQGKVFGVPLRMVRAHVGLFLVIHYFLTPVYAVMDSYSLANSSYVFFSNAREHVTSPAPKGYEWLSLHQHLEHMTSGLAYDNGRKLLMLMDIVDGQAPKRVVTLGLMYNGTEWIALPHEGPAPQALIMAREISSDIFNLEISGVRFGTSVPTFTPLHYIIHGLLLTWDRQDRRNHLYRTVNPSMPISLRKLIGDGWEWLIAALLSGRSS